MGRMKISWRKYANLKQADALFFHVRITHEVSRSMLRESLAYWVAESAPESVPTRDELLDWIRRRLEQDGSEFFINWTDEREKGEVDEARGRAAKLLSELFPELTEYIERLNLIDED